MAYGKNLPDWYVNRKPVEPMSEAELARRDEEFERHVQFWEQAKRDAYFSDYMTDEGYPEFYYIANEVFEFASAGKELVFYTKQGEPSCKRVFTPDLVMRDVGKEIMALAEAGNFKSDKFN